ncbi:hypothetical protein BJX70DRAFT_112212 [Aspergillus crustosus]
MSESDIDATSPGTTPVQRHGKMILVGLCDHLLPTHTSFCHECANQPERLESLHVRQRPGFSSHLAGLLVPYQGPPWWFRYDHMAIMTTHQFLEYYGSSRALFLSHKRHAIHYPQGKAPTPPPSTEWGVAVAHCYCGTRMACFRSHLKTTTTNTACQKQKDTPRLGVEPRSPALVPLED